MVMIGKSLAHELAIHEWHSVQTDRHMYMCRLHDMTFSTWCMYNLQVTSLQSHMESWWTCISSTINMVKDEVPDVTVS